MKLRAASFSPLHGGPLQQVAQLYDKLQTLYRNIRAAVNANEDGVFITEVTADNDATLDLGDVSGDAFWEKYQFVICRLHSILPASSGQTLHIRYGGGGSWWTAVSYEYTYRTLGIYSDLQSMIAQTSVQCWTNSSSAYTQGNDVYDELYGTVRIALAKSSGIEASHAMRAELEWANSTALSDLESGIIMARYKTTSHISALRFYYESGNIYGTARLFGWPKS